MQGTQERDVPYGLGTARLLQDFLAPRLNEATAIHPAYFLIAQCLLVQKQHRSLSDFISIPLPQTQG